MKALLANVLMNDVLNWWNGAGPPELNEASVAADEAIKLNSNSALAHHAQGLVQSAKGHHNDARKAFREAKRKDDRFARGHAQFGNQKSFLGRLDEVQDPLDKAISLINLYHPARGYFYWGKGRGYFEQAVRSNDFADWSNALKWLGGLRHGTPDGLVQPLLSGRRAKFQRRIDGAQQTIDEFIAKFDQDTFDRIKKLTPDPKDPARKVMLDFVQPRLPHA